MTNPKDRSANRKTRKDGRRTDHGPLLELVKEEQSRRPVKSRTKEIVALTDAQRHYDAAIQSKLITFGIGPAGTGKTWLAATRAAEALKVGVIKQIIVTRPALEAGEKLGFLPGEIDEKYEPFFRPVRDALAETLGSGPLEYYLKAGVVEARPLSYLRGATLKDCWVIADEMQNSTRTEMKLLLTRFGENAKFIINGDETQCDLPDPSRSGLMDAVQRLRSNPQIGLVEFTVADIVRHGIVRDIIEAYSSAAPATNDTGLKAYLHA
jgi:phosphate starvation-inducible protein PhoH and related proteins